MPSAAESVLREKVVAPIYYGPQRRGVVFARRVRRVLCTVLLSKGSTLFGNPIWQARSFRIWSEQFRKQCMRVRGSLRVKKSR